MSPTTPDELEIGLRELFERQAEAIPAHVRAWDDPPMATVETLKPRRPRSVFAAVVATAAAIALVVGVAALGPGRGVHVAGQPGTPAPVHFATPQVTFDATALLIDAEGRRFTSGGSVVDVNSDPGIPNNYTTLELTWNERGVEMRLYMYFASDGHNWWSNEIRTYNGHAPGDWIYYTGTFFRDTAGHRVHRQRRPLPDRRQGPPANLESAASALPAAGRVQERDVEVRVQHRVRPRQDPE